MSFSGLRQKCMERFDNRGATSRLRLAGVYVLLVLNLQEEAGKQSGSGCAIVGCARLSLDRNVNALQQLSTDHKIRANASQSAADKSSWSALGVLFQWLWSCMSAVASVKSGQGPRKARKALQGGHVAPGSTVSPVQGKGHGDDRRRVCVRRCSQDLQGTKSPP